MWGEHAGGAISRTTWPHASKARGHITPGGRRPDPTHSPHYPVHNTHMPYACGMAARRCRRRALAGGRHARTRRGECFAPSARPPTESLTPEAGWRRVPSGTTRVRPCRCSLWPAHALLLVPSGLPSLPAPQVAQRECILCIARVSRRVAACGRAAALRPRACLLRRASRLRRAANTRLATSLVTSRQGIRARPPRPRLCETNGAPRTSP